MSQYNVEPFRFLALATKNLIRGELIRLRVDGDGRIVSDKLEFIQPTTPRIAKIAQTTPYLPQRDDDHSPVQIHPPHDGFTAGVKPDRASELEDCGH